MERRQRQRQDCGQWTWSWPMPRCGLGRYECSSRHFRQHIEVMEFFFFYGWKEKDRNCKFPQFHLGGNEGGKGDSHAREKRRRHHTKIFQRQNPECVGRRSRGGGQIIQGGRPGNHEPTLLVQGARNGEAITWSRPLHLQLWIRNVPRSVGISSSIILFIISDMLPCRMNTLIIVLGTAVL